MAKSKAKKVGPARKATLKAKTTKAQALAALGDVLARTSLTLRECTVLRQCCDARLAQLAAGPERGPEPPDRTATATEVRALFEKLTGHPLDTEV